MNATQQANNRPLTDRQVQRLDKYLVGLSVTGAGMILIPDPTKRGVHAFFPEGDRSRVRVEWPNTALSDKGALALQQHLYDSGLRAARPSLRAVDIAYFNWVRGGVECSVRIRRNHGRLTVSLWQDATRAKPSAPALFA